MFKNVGSKLRSISFFILLLGIVLTIVGIIRIFMGMSARNGEAVVMSGLLVVASGIAVMLLSLFADGFGKLIENTDIIAENFQKPDARAKNNSEPYVPAHHKPIQAEESPESEDFEPSDDRDDSPVEAENSWLCKKCGTINPNSVWDCKYCESPKWYSR